MNRNILLAGAMMLTLSACDMPGSGGAAAGGAGIATPIPQTDADKLKVAMDIATVMNGEDALDRMMSGGGMMPDLTKACEAAPADQKEACTATMTARQAKIKPVMDEYIAKAKAALPGMQQDMAEEIAKSFSGAELARMRDFYASPEGKSITQKLPDVLAKAIPKMMVKLQPLVSELSMKISAAVSTP